MKNHNNKIIGILTTSQNYDQVISMNEQLYEEIIKKFKHLYIIDLSKLLIVKKESKKIFCKKKNIKYFVPKNSHELISFLSGKKMIAFNELGKSFNFYKIYYVLRKLDLILILLLNIGYLTNTVEINTNGIKNLLNSTFFKLEKTFFKKLYRVFNLLNIFPRIDYYFDASKQVIRNISNSKINLLEKKIPFLKISYFKNPILINSRSFDKIKKAKNISNKYISFIDSQVDHLDRVKREGKINKEIISNYYKLINKLLCEFKKKYKKQIVFCIHPQNNNKLIKKYFSNFLIKKYQTFKYIKQSHIVLFHESSAALDAILFNKPLISLETKFLGDYLSKRTKNYIQTLGTFSINLDSFNKLDKKNIKNFISIPKTKMKWYINNYLKADGNNLGYKKVINIIKKIN